MSQSSITRRGGTISELLAGLAALALLAALVIPGAARMRAESRTASSLSQLRWVAGATSSYAADNADRTWTYSWTAGPLPHSDPTLPASASSDVQAAAIQAVDIMRRRGRPDMPEAPLWIPHILYSHLPLLDYLDRDMPDFNMVSPADKYRLAWARDPEAHDRGEFLPYQEPPTDQGKRWPYSSSFHLPSAFYDRSSAGSRITQGSTHRFYFFFPGGSVISGAPLSEVAFPAQKVFLADSEQREAGAGPQFSLVESSRVVSLMADGAAGLVTTADANPGWRPNLPLDPEPTHFEYEPSAWEAPTSTGEPTELVAGHYRWTRGGIAGRDFGGPEVDTGQ